MQKKVLILLGLILTPIVIALVVAAPAIDAWMLPPDFNEMRSSVTVNIKKADGTPSTRRVGPKAPGWVKLKHISEYVVSAVLSSEDTAFFSHEGVDFHELKEAIKKDLQEQRFARGASTLTQQVIKNTFLTQEKTLTRKIKEVLWAYQLEKQFTKFEILNFYLNLVEWGPGVYGIEQAAYRYFGRSPSNLSAKQGAFLALLLPSPVKYSVYHTRRTLTPWASQRVNHILKIMHSMKFIDAATYREALEESLWGETPSASESDEDPTGEDKDLPAAPPPVRDTPRLTEEKGTPSPSPTPEPDVSKTEPKVEKGAEPEKTTAPSPPVDAFPAPAPPTEAPPTEKAD